MRKKLPLLLSLFLFTIAISLAQPGVNDPTFNTADDGTYGNGTGFGNRIYTTAIQSDGKIIVGGSFGSYNGEITGKITRLNTDGSIDVYFNIGAGFNDTVKSIAIQNDGKIIVGGYFTSFNGTTINRIARLNTNGSLDNSFNPGAGFNGNVESVAIQSDGNIIIGGAFTSFNGTTTNRIARLDINGILDPTFITGTGFSNIVTSVVIQNDGKIIVGGGFTSFNSTSRNCIARLNTNGSLDNTFNPGTGFTGIVFSTAIQSDGKIITGGAFSSFNGTIIYGIVRLDTDGSLDTSFNPGSGFNNHVISTAIQSDGKIITGGKFTSYNGTTINRIARLNIDGTLDTSFDTGSGCNDHVYTIAVQSDGKIIIGGGFQFFNVDYRNRIARLSTNGTLDPSFITGTGFSHPASSISIQSDEKIIAGGSFASYNGTLRNRIARLNADGSLDTTFNPGIGFNNHVISTAIQSNGKIIVCGQFTSFNNTPRNFLARLNTNGTIDTSFSLGFNHYVNSIAIQSDGKIIIGGHFTSINGTTINRIARLNTNGSLDNSFNPGTGFENIVSSTVIQSDGKIIIGGSFTSFNGVSRNRIVRLNPDGTLDASFNPGTGFDNTVSSTVIQTDGKLIVGGSFNYFNGNYAKHIARLNTDGTIDASFSTGTGFNISPMSIAIQSNGKIIAGGQFTTYNGIQANRIARLNTDGSSDVSFIGTGFNNGSNTLGGGSLLYVGSIAIQSDGKIITGGHFSSYDGITRNRIARLFGDFSPGYYPHYIKGLTYSDLNNDCEKQSNEQGIPLILTTIPPHSYAYSDSTGLYSLGVNDSVNYLIKPIIPQRLQHYVSNPCPADYSVLLDITHPQDTAGFDFGFDYLPCHQLRVDVASNRRRRCFLNTTTVFYTNEGIIPANGVEVSVKMPEYVIPVSASLPYSWNASDSTMKFNIGTLNNSQSGFITIVDSVACVNGITGLTQCTKAWITPANSCIMNDTVGSGWDKSSVMVTGSCISDTVVFVIYNTGDFGDGDMDGPSEYRIYANNALMQTVPFQLNGGDSLVVSVVSGGATIRLEADQRLGHPGNSQPRETIEACGTSTTGTFTTGVVNLAPQDDVDLHVEIDCLSIIDSYDPNDKQASPAGIGPDKIVLPGTLLDFTLRFQNTGTDTAYKVVVIDTLSNHFDISTLELGTSSFPFTFKMSGSGNPVLIFTFNGINLTDTFTNEVGSHGFVKFKIAPNDTIPLGTIIDNFVDIFFDYNLPIRTNTATVRIDSLNYTASDLATVVNSPFLNAYYCSGDSARLIANFSGNNLEYQWYKDSIAIAGAVNDTLFLNPVALSDTGSYYCQATGHLNSVKTLSAILQVKETTSITQMAAAVLACEGTTGQSLSVTANGDNLSYQWYKDGVVINGQSNELIFSNLLSPDAGEYYCTISGTCGVDVSDSAMVMVYELPQVLANTTVSVICFNDTITLTGSGAVSYIWNNGVTNGVTFNPASTLTFTVIGMDSNGCIDSDSLEIVVNPLPNITASADQATVCLGENVVLTASGSMNYIWDNGVINGVSFTPSVTTTYSVNASDGNGCENTDTITVIVNEPTTLSLTETACGSFTLNNQTYASGGIYTQLLQNSVGCDSTITLNLTIINTTTNILTETACDSYTLNNQTYTASGTYSQLLQNTAGCDSTITLNLTINTANVSVEQMDVMLSANTSGANYQWLDCNNSFAVISGASSQNFIPATNGNYAVVVIENNCIDTSACYAITTIGIEENTAGNNLLIYPNPTSGNITLSSETPLNNAGIKILTISGQVILEEKNLKGKNFQFDLNKEARGIYLMEINTGEEIKRVKLILN
ncbi:MAG: T9SS type A sorting domain-containing protein [Bacteroidota bacterium]|nr:T9SS type A sorting domain-containing protein [Bacteroidota bacterium]